MEEFTPLRRDLLKGLGSLAMFTAFAEGAGASTASAQPADKPGVLNVRDFGAKGDGKSDDTSAFQRAIDAAQVMGGNIVFIPRGDYLIAGTLEVREHVVPEASSADPPPAHKTEVPLCWRSPGRDRWKARPSSPSARTPPYTASPSSIPNRFNRTRRIPPVDSSRHRH